MKSLLIILFLQINFIYSQTNYERSDSPADSEFPGGYISLGIQFGENNNAIKFRSYQINLGLGLTNSPQSFVGLTIGNRIFKNESNYNYVDLQFSCAFLAGVGIGIALKDNKIYHRRKSWIGLGPIMYSKDGIYIDEVPQKSKGVIFALPIPKFGYAFYP
tara:strand:- start:99 stop:578 length:480 start_codon:yes stop_codon:yes gene_type:complete